MSRPEDQSRDGEGSVESLRRWERTGCLVPATFRGLTSSRRNCLRWSAPWSRLAASLTCAKPPASVRTVSLGLRHVDGWSLLGETPQGRLGLEAHEIPLPLGQLLQHLLRLLAADAFEHLDAT